MENNIKRYQIMSRSGEGEVCGFISQTAIVIEPDRPSPLPHGRLKVSLPTQMTKYDCIYFLNYKLIQFNTNVCLSLTFVPNVKSKSI